MNKLLAYLSVMTIACMASAPVLAGDYDDYDHGGAKAWHEKDGGKKMGKHEMSGTIENLDHKTGWVTVKTGEGNLNVHFPPDALKDLKTGDTITVHLGFTKGEEMKGMEMKDHGKMMK
jgi:hypothetical protein